MSISAKEKMARDIANPRMRAEVPLLQLMYDLEHGSYPLVDPDSPAPSVQVPLAVLNDLHKGIHWGDDSDDGLGTLFEDEARAAGADYERGR